MLMMEKPLPPRILTALTLAAGGSSWSDAAGAVGMKAPTLRKYAKDPRANEFVERVVRENLNQANSLIANASPRLAEELVTIALDPAVKAYARISAIAEAFKILSQNVLEAEQRKQLQAIRSQLQAIEDGVDHSQVIDI
jgi:hypothetical protein